MPIQNTQRAANAAGDSLASAFTVTCGAANTKGAYAQMWASTVIDSGFLVLMPDDITVSATNTSVLLDIAVGAAGSERDLIANVNLGAWGHGSIFQAPVFIPAGSRVALRAQSAVASKVLNGRISLIPATDLGDAAKVCDTYGANTATSAGTTLATPSSSGVKTGWTQITASTTRDHRWLAWSLASTGTNVAASKGGFDIGYGASGSEQPLVQNARWEQLGAETVRPCQYVYPVSLAAGTRLAVRWDSTSTAAASVLNAVVYGFA